MLIRSGLSILMDHPRLYFNNHCTPGTEWIRLSPLSVPKDRIWTAERVGRVTLGENDVRGSVGHGGSSGPCGSEKPVHVERRRRCALHDDSSDYRTAVEAAVHIRGHRLLSTEC
jgi:hypothetical protein